MRNILFVFIFVLSVISCSNSDDAESVLNTNFNYTVIGYEFDENIHENTHYQIDVNGKTGETNTVNLSEDLEIYPINRNVTIVGDLVTFHSYNEPWNVWQKEIISGKVLKFIDYIPSNLDVYYPLNNQDKIVNLVYNFNDTRYEAIHVFDKAQNKHKYIELGRDTHGLRPSVRNSIFSCVTFYEDDLFLTVVNIDELKINTHILVESRPNEYNTFRGSAIDVDNNLIHAFFEGNKYKTYRISDGLFISEGVHDIEGLNEGTLAYRSSFNNGKLYCPVLNGNPNIWWLSKIYDFKNKELKVVNFKNSLVDLNKAFGDSVYISVFDYHPSYNLILVGFSYQENEIEKYGVAFTDSDGNLIDYDLIDKAPGSFVFTDL